MKKNLFFILLFSLCFAVASDAFAASSIGAFDKLNTIVNGMVKNLNTGASTLMKYSNALTCYATYGETSYIELTLPLVDWTVNIHVIDIMVWLCGAILYVIGFFVLIIASFYTFDVAFNLSVAIVFLPLALALYPFSWTREFLKTVVGVVLYYTGVFIFLPLGINLGVTLVNIAASDIGFDFNHAYTEGESKLIKDNFSLFTINFWKMVLYFIVAVRMIPLMAKEFCGHFFSSGMAASTISNAIAGLASKTKNAIGSRVGARGKKAIGNAMKNNSSKNGSFMSKAVNRYGRHLAGG